MQNIQKITIKYIGKIDEQNYVIVNSDGHKNGKFITNGTFLHNTKLTASKFNEDKLRQKKRGNSHAYGRALTEMLHSMLKYSEVWTDLSFICIPTTPLEFRQSIKLINIENNENAHKNIPEDSIEDGNICHNARTNLNLPQRRQYTPSQISTLTENIYDSFIDNITEFSVQPPELRACFDQVGN